MQLRHRHVERGLVGIFQVQELRGAAFALTQVDVDQAQVAPDAVVHVHHRVAHFELRQVFDQRIDIAGQFLLAAPARGGRQGKHFGFGDELQSPCRLP